MMSPEQWIARLARLHNAQLPELELLDSYYEGEQSLSYLHPELIRRLNGRVRQVVINWPQLPGTPPTAAQLVNAVGEDQAELIRQLRRLGYLR